MSKKFIVLISLCAVLLCVGVGFGIWTYLQNANEKLETACFENSDINSCHQIIDKKHPNAERCAKRQCTKLGKAYKGVGDFKASFAYFEKDCDRNLGEACNNLGLLYSNGEGTKHDNIAANALFLKACELKESVGCYNLSLSFEHGLGTKKDTEAANIYADKVCELNNPDLCYQVGFKYLEKKHYKKAIKFITKSCDLRHNHACFVMGDFYRQGAFVEQNYAMARRFYEISCAANHDKSCFYLAELYANGNGVKGSIFSVERYEKSKLYYDKACELGHQNACDALQQFELVDVGVSIFGGILEWLLK